MPADLQRARELFLHAVGNLPPEEWDGYVAAACGGDMELGRQARHLLQVHLEAGSFLERPAVGLGATGDFLPAPAVTVPATPAEGPGTVIGPYKLLQLIGEGGMGAVWMAEQQEPVQRKVALKVIKPGMDSRQVIARFEAERQALALMDHPNIAKVLDAGTTDSGRPYFVMELVKGVSITRFCDERRLTLRQRLELVVPVCQAVQHAHQKSIIHRDLKPSNVLVALYDGRPMPKVIDFGIAKATGPRLTGRTLFTEFGAILGTFEYMSPEQAELNPLDIDTRSDIYTLGVLLYELLTGSTPLERKQLKDKPLWEVLRIIREEQTPRPSTRLSTTKELPAIAGNRGLKPKKLSGLVRGDLETIVLKATAKNREDRYATAQELADDLRCFLDDQPIRARPPTLVRRSQKWARRHRVLVRTAAACGLLGLVLAVGGLAASNALIRNERDKADAAQREAMASLNTARKAVNQMLVRLGGERLNFVPQMEEVRRDMLRYAVDLYQELQQRYPDDRELQQEAALVTASLGSTLMKQGRKAEAEEMSRRAIAALEKLADLGPLEPPTREQHIRAYINLGWLLTSVPGRREDGIAAHQQAVLLAEKLAAGIPDAPRYRDLLAGACIDLGIVWRPTRPRDTEALLTRAITLLSETQGNGHYLGRAYLALGELCFEEERLPEAEQAFRRAKAIQETLVSASPQVWQLRERLGDTNLHLGRVLAATGRGEEAEQALREAVAICDQLRAEYPAVPIYRDSLAISQAALLMVLEPGTSSKEAEELAGKLQATQPDNVHAHARMAWALANGPEEKLRDSRRAVALARKAVEMDPERAVHWRALALAHYRVSEAREALAALDKARAQTGREDGFDLFLRALASWQLGEKEPSRRSLAAAVTWTQQHRPEDAELRRLRREAENLMGPVNP